MPSNPIDGVLLIDKAVGMTSHDVVAIARKALDMKKVGHCGTLDPLATGLLILVLGKGTKIQDLLMSEDKEYVGAMLFGQTTNTQDAEGEVLEEKPTDDLSEDSVKAAFEKFTGDFYQTPPMVSAVKKDGVPLYKLARKGKEVEREPRLVHVYGYKLLNIEFPEVQFQVRCSKGFYVRTYAHDIGQEVGCGAHISALRRTRSGNFRVEGAVKAMDLKTMPRDEIYEKVLSLPEVSRMRGV